ncbi:2Fe-2S ferredoxin-like protein [Alteromonas sp. 5E99-2]|uniref:class I ribonucleotide reductase maintenance protein YfaE n=1 Tax=Alteromonas sp. 5E99-2 TaxID=2817683 RepID=UPI001A9812D5|nr:class I ribonucleotide reductase maintenance protein YfaE [Alteromonas sp. 5E99-2]MBO1255570.1 2Fe-2S ferredoxin-like protein [Alteromonas sp. 5E99-2]
MSNTEKGIQITLIDTDTLPSLPNKTLLESIEAKNIEVPYHCRDGFCGACRCKLIKGDVDYTIDPLAFIDDDEVLLCCSVPLTDVTLKLE